MSDDAKIDRNHVRELEQELDTAERALVDGKPVPAYQAVKYVREELERIREHAE